MLSITARDSLEINDSYNNLLNNISNRLIDTNEKDELNLYKCLLRLIYDGAFSMESSFIRKNGFNYLDFSCISTGAQVMYGIACCRHLCTFINDVFIKSGYQTSLLKIYIDKNGEWHLNKDGKFSFNHTTVLIDSDIGRYILDPMNNFILQWLSNNDLLEITDRMVDTSRFSGFKDENVEKIGKVLKKYYTLRELGVKTVYDYDI